MKKDSIHYQAVLLILMLLISGLALLSLRCWIDQIWQSIAVTGRTPVTLSWGQWLSILNLNRLPLDLQQSVSILLLLPLSALITALCRNLIGIVTFGTFGPALLALALSLTHWQVGLISILVIFAIGLVASKGLETLRLLMVPRQGILLTLVVTVMVLGTSLMHYLEPMRATSAVLLPTVILAGLVERIFHETSEEGILPTTYRGLGTVVVGYCCYLIFRSQSLAHLVVSYPELHCLTLAGMVGVGRYSGYRLSELSRFGHLVQELQHLQQSAVKLADPVMRQVRTSRSFGLQTWTAFVMAQSASAPAARTWVWPWQLRSHGILGINRRNTDYVLKHNPRCLYPYVDNKSLTKTFCQEQGLPYPQTYALIENYGQIQPFLQQLQHWREVRDFVIKPTRGSGGRGILVIADHDGQRFCKPNGAWLTLAELQHHLSSILSGLYALDQEPDQVMVEQRILPHPNLQAIVTDGTPDLRVILFQGVPVMAMMRLPTRKSQGRANLHQGAIAAAVDLLTGMTRGGVYQDQLIEQHPDTHHSLQNVQVPHWPEVLQTVIHLGSHLGMGYIGVDLVIDANQGPMVLEINARPGLAIQIANRCGLRHRLEFLAAQPSGHQHTDPFELLQLVAQIDGTVLRPQAGLDYRPNAPLRSPVGSKFLP